ncbi:MAG: prevent-host-death protein [Gammaproteobacteria bacterium]|nr:prevent-host-death protein [Gammaproteobacteria bacterium]
MYAVNVRNLKKNPSLALRQARLEPVLILKGNEPDALLLHLDKSITETEKNLRPALAAVLYREGVLSLGAAARLSSLALIDFIRHLDSLGIEIVTADETVEQETRDVSAWLKSS